MNISLTPEQERVVEDELKSGRYHNIEQLLGAALRALCETRRDVPTTRTQRDAVREMLDFVDQNSVRLEGVSVRDLIHEGHRF